MNNDMVKPIPHSHAAPNICRPETPAGDVATLIFVEHQANSEIPMGLPTESEYDLYKKPRSPGQRVWKRGLLKDESSPISTLRLISGLRERRRWTSARP
jgi:hypothetical protein